MLLKTVAKDDFFKTGWCEEVLKKVALEPLASALGVAVFLHNAHYKEALEKKLQA